MKRRDGNLGTPDNARHTCASIPLRMRERHVGAVLALLLGIVVFLIALMALPASSGGSSAAGGSGVCVSASRVLTYVLRVVLCYGLALGALSAWTLASRSRLASWLSAAVTSLGTFLTCAAVLSGMHGLWLVLLPLFLGSTALLVRAGLAHPRTYASTESRGFPTAS